MADDKGIFGRGGAAFVCTKTIVGAFINTFSPTQMAFIKKIVVITNVRFLRQFACCVPGS